MANLTADLAARVLQRVDCQLLWENALTQLTTQFPVCYSRSMEDLQTLVRFTVEDWREHNEDAAKDQLFQLAWPGIRKILVAGIASWYRDQLAMVPQAPPAPNEEVEVDSCDLGEAGA